MDPGEESFSWSSFDFNSSFRFYSSDDDNVSDRELHKDDPDTYIEFEIDSSTYHGTDQEFEFCISDPKFAIDDNPAPPAKVVGSTSRGSIGNCTSTLFRIFRDAGPQRSVPKPVIDGDHGSDDDYRINSCNNWELVRSRKASTDKTSMGKGEILNLLRSIIISLQSTPTRNKTHSRRSWGIANLMTPIDNMFNKWRMYDLHRTMVKRSNGCEEKSKPKGYLEDFKLTGVLMKLFVAAGRSNNRVVVGRIALSCPTSVNSSPIHQSGDAAASSVRAAIAHCKKSLGQTDDFCF